MTQIPASIAKGLVEAQRAVKGVGKGNVNEHHGYRYASAQDVAAEAQRALNGAGLALCRVGWSHVPIAEREPARLVVTYILTSLAGESWTLEPVSVPSLPGKGRPEDKAEAAALTYSAGYVAQGLLQIERLDENDVDARNDNEPRVAQYVAELSNLIRTCPQEKKGEVKAKVDAQWSRMTAAEQDEIDKAMRERKASGK